MFPSRKENVLELMLITKIPYCIENSDKLSDLYWILVMLFFVMKMKIGNKNKFLTTERIYVLRKEATS